MTTWPGDSAIVESTSIFWYVRTILPRLRGLTSYALVKPGEAGLPRGAAIFPGGFLSPDRHSTRFLGIADAKLKATDRN
jgi:hypothetical protein